MSQADLDQLDEELSEMGPIDWVVLAWPNGQPNGQAAPMIVDLVDRGIIRILDAAFIAKDADGTVGALEVSQFDDEGHFAVFEGASSGLLGDEDLEEAAAGLEPNTAAAVLVWENRWAAPVATSIRKSGGLLIDGGRIPVQGIVAALDALEAAQAN
jgi:hypothetical protein